MQNHAAEEEILSKHLPFPMYFGKQDAFDIFGTLKSNTFLIAELLGEGMMWSAKLITLYTGTKKKMVPETVPLLH